MKYMILPLLLLSGLLAAAQQPPPAFDAEHWIPPYKLSIPPGWTIERFPIPIEFAPSIAYSGVEDIRFAPGWGNPKGEDYWTYAFLWFLKGKQHFTPAIIEKNLQAYYTGLVGRNIERRQIPPEKLFPVTAKFEKIRAAPGDSSTFRGTIHMLDYMEQQPMTLNCLVHVQTCPGLDSSFVFYEVSPQPSGHSVWNTLNRIWTAFDCSAE